MAQTFRSGLISYRAEGFLGAEVLESEASLHDSERTQIL